MEWQGINLTAFHQKQWANSVIRKTIFLIISFFIALFIFSTTLYFIKDKKLELASFTKVITQQESNIKTLRQKINTITNKKSFSKELSLTLTDVNDFLNSVYQLPLTYSSLEIAAINHTENGDKKISLVGSFSKQDEIENIEKYFVKNNIAYHIDEIYLKDDHTSGFRITINIAREEQ